MWASASDTSIYLMWRGRGGRRGSKVTRPISRHKRNNKPRINSFWDVSYNLLGEGEEEDVEEIHMSQNVVTTRSGKKTSSSDSPSTSEPAKTTSTTRKHIPMVNKLHLLLPYLN
jgi:hypothetical protein